jgi:hypothetical protein
MMRKLHVMPCKKWILVIYGRKIQVINRKAIPEITPLHSHKGLIKMNMKVKMSTMIKSKWRAMINGEMRMVGIMEKHHQIQECATTFKVITREQYIEKGVTTRSRVVNFCEHYLFVSSFEPLNVEDALYDPDWVVAMQ